MEQKKSVSKFECRDTTHFEWLPDGVHLITATLSPRLRVNNWWVGVGGVCKESISLFFEWFFSLHILHFLTTAIKSGTIRDL